MILALVLLACGATEGTAVGSLLLEVQASSAAPDGATPVTNSATVEICNGDAAAEVFTTAVPIPDGPVRIVGVKATLTKNMGWEITGQGGQPTDAGEQQTVDLTFQCRRNETASVRNRESKVRVGADGVLVTL